MKKNDFQMQFSIVPNGEQGATSISAIQGAERITILMEKVGESII